MKTNKMGDSFFGDSLPRVHIIKNERVKKDIGSIFIEISFIFRKKIHTNYLGNNLGIWEYYDNLHLRKNIEKNKNTNME